MPARALTVILAAGEGKRMQSVLPKVLHRIGRKPLIEHLVQASLKSGLGRVIIVVGHRRDMVIESLVDYPIEYVVQADQHGTGHAMQMVADYVGNYDGSCLVLPGDAPFVRPETMRRLVEFHEAGSYAATLFTAEVADTTGYGRVVRGTSAIEFACTALNTSPKDRIRQTGRLSLTMETDKAYAPTFVLNCLTANVAAIVDKKLVQSKEANNDLGYGWLKTNYAGSGPLKIREWRANEILALERNDNYHGAKSKLPRVIYRHVKEAATQRLLLEKGDVDIARNLTPQDLAALAANRDIRTTATPKGTVYYFSLNQKHPTLSRAEVREAMKWLVDYAAIGDTLIKNIGVVHQNFLPIGLLGASTENPYKLDVDRAKALLAKAGVPNGFKVTIDMRTVQPVQGITEAFQQTAKRAGIDVEILPGDGKQTLTKYRARTHDIYIGQWGADYWDPHTNADTFARNPDNSDDAKSKPLAWRNAWAIPELTKKADAAVLERDPAKRRAMYEEMQADFRKNSPFVMLYQQTEVAAFRADVEGLKLGPTSDTTYMFRVSKR
jgi:peptide/nickel transport system substrate-binding protein